MQHKDFYIRIGALALIRGIKRVRKAANVLPDHLGYCGLRHLDYLSRLSAAKSVRVAVKLISWSVWPEILQKWMLLNPLILFKYALRILNDIRILSQIGFRKHLPLRLLRGILRSPFSALTRISWGYAQQALVSVWVTWSRCLIAFQVLAWFQMFFCVGIWPSIS